MDLSQSRPSDPTYLSRVMLDQGNLKSPKDVKTLFLSASSEIAATLPPCPQDWHAGRTSWPSPQYSLSSLSSPFKKSILSSCSCVYLSRSNRSVDHETACSHNSGRQRSRREGPTHHPQLYHQQAYERFRSSLALLTFLNFRLPSS